MEEKLDSIHVPPVSVNHVLTKTKKTLYQQLTEVKRDAGRKLFLVLIGCVMVVAAGGVIAPQDYIILSSLLGINITVLLLSVEAAWFIRQIKELKEENKALAESHVRTQQILDLDHTRHELLIEDHPHGVMELNLIDNLIVYTNPTFHNLLGYSLRELNGGLKVVPIRDRPKWLIHKLFVEEQHEEVCRVLRELNYNRLIPDERKIYFLRKKDQTTFPAMIRMRITDLSKYGNTYNLGTTIVFQSVIMDLTEILGLKGTVIGQGDLMYKMMDELLQERTIQGHRERIKTLMKEANKKKNI